MLRTIERRGDEDAIARIADTECEVVDGRAAPSREDHLLGQDGLVRLEVSVEDIVGKMAAKKSGTGGTLAISKKLIGFWFRQRHTHDIRKKGLEKKKKKEIRCLVSFCQPPAQQNGRRLFSLLCSELCSLSFLRC